MSTNSTVDLTARPWEHQLCSEVVDCYNRITWTSSSCQLACTECTKVLRFNILCILLFSWSWAPAGFCRWSNCGLSIPAITCPRQADEYWQHLRPIFPQRLLAHDVTHQTPSLFSPLEPSNFERNLLFKNLLLRVLITIHFSKWPFLGATISFFSKSGAAKFKSQRYLCAIPPPRKRFYNIWHRKD